MLFLVVLPVWHLISPLDYNPPLCPWTILKNKNEEKMIVTFFGFLTLYNMSLTSHRDIKKDRGTLCGNKSCGVSGYISKQLSTRSRQCKLFVYTSRDCWDLSVCGVVFENRPAPFCFVAGDGSSDLTCSAADSSDRHVASVPTVVSFCIRPELDRLIQPVASYSSAPPVLVIIAQFGCE